MEFERKMEKLKENNKRVVTLLQVESKRNEPVESIV
jgi:hypothetical protein